MAREADQFEINMEDLSSVDALIEEFIADRALVN